MAIGGAAVIIPVAIQGAIELAKLAMDLIDTWKNDPQNQAEIDAKWAAMQQSRTASLAAWEASKKKNNQ